MAAGSLPEDGELRLGTVSLPAGQRVARAGDDGEAVAWITTGAVADAGRAWLALSDAHQQTGLVPMLLADSQVEETEGFFIDDDAASTADLDRMDAAGLLRNFWDEALPDDEADWDGPRLVEARAPFSREFPGLAPGEDTQLSPDRPDAALSSVTGRTPTGIDFGALNKLRGADQVTVPG